jgi:GT2 family glycosyltransferase
VPLGANPTDYERNAASLEVGQFVTANCFYRKSVLEHIGGFDERFRAAWREDTDVFFSLLEEGCHLVSSSEAVVYHPPREAPWGVSLRQQRKSQFNALLYKKHPALYRQRIQPSPPWSYYFTCLALLGLARARSQGKRSLATLSLVTWTALSGRFLSRRLKRTSHSPTHVAEMAATSVLIPPLAVFWRLQGAVKFRVWFL